MSEEGRKFDLMTNTIRTTNDDGESVIMITWKDGVTEEQKRAFLDKFHRYVKESQEGSKDE